MIFKILRRLFLDFTEITFALFCFCKPKCCLVYQFKTSRLDLVMKSKVLSLIILLSLYFLYCFGSQKNNIQYDTGFHVWSSVRLLDFSNFNIIKPDIETCTSRYFWPVQICTVSTFLYITCVCPGRIFLTFMWDHFKYISF